MKPSWMVVLLLVLLAGCKTDQGTGGSGPSPGVQPATKKELPWLPVFGGRMKTTLFYGPWQCRQEFMQACQMECAGQKPKRKLMGCMWLADIKLDWEGRLVIPPLPVKAGGRYAITHCCCDYRKLEPAEKKPLRDAWDGVRESFRQDWSKRFGQWPSEGGKYWPGHHIRDLWHGGDPVNPNNILPVEPLVHDIFSKAYPFCYAGQAPWNTVGPNLPYTDK